MRSLLTDKLAIAYGQKVVVRDLNMTLPSGKVTALVGANGSGKSTILKTLARLIKPLSGSVLLDGKSIHKQPTREIARHLAMLPQNPQAPEQMTVYELVSYGRTPYLSGMHTLSDKDTRKISKALAATGLSGLQNRAVDSLSGGQRQRAWIAMALAQDTDWLFLDEPTTYLDMKYQIDTLNLLKKLNQEEKKTIVMVLHDLNQAVQFSDYLIAIKNGQIISQGTSNVIMTKPMLETVFGVKADMITDPRTKRPIFLPYATVRTQEEGG
jgi:iron complex transport system ATP-binding protein